MGWRDIAFTAVGTRLYDLKRGHDQLAPRLESMTPEDAQRYDEVWHSLAAVEHHRHLLVVPVEAGELLKAAETGLKMLQARYLTPTANREPALHPHPNPLS
jgi:hypothetical protein